MPPPIARQTLRSVPDDIADISEPIHTSSGQKNKAKVPAESSVSVIESSQNKKKSREQSYLSQENVISPSKKQA